MAEPLVSVLLPVRDAKDYLEQCIASLNRQTLTNFEVVVVDDGSEDGSRELLEKWASDDERVNLIRQEPKGLVEALNNGLEHCRAPFVARMDADDISHPRRLELQVAELEEMPWVGVVSSWVRHFRWHGVGEGFRIYESWLNSLCTPETIGRERFVESPVAHPSVMVRRELMTKVGGYEDNGWPEDFDLWLRMLEAGVSFSKIERFLFFWRDHTERLTKVDGRYSVENFLRCKAKYLLSGPLTECQRLIVWGAGQTGRRLSKHLLRGGAEIECFLDIDPEKIGSTLREIPIKDAGDPAIFVGEGTLVLVAVASRGARQIIRDALNARGLREGREYWCVA